MTPEAEKYREQLRAMLPDLRQRFGVESLGLFGSRVRGDHRPDSDLDVLVTFERGRTPGLFRYVELEDLLAERLGMKIDLVDSEALKPYIGRRVREEVRYCEPAQN